MAATTGGATRDMAPQFRLSAGVQGLLGDMATSSNHALALGLCRPHAHARRGRGPHTPRLPVPTRRCAPLPCEGRRVRHATQRLSVRMKGGMDMGPSPDELQRTLNKLPPALLPQLLKIVEMSAAAEDTKKSGTRLSQLQYRDTSPSKSETLYDAAAALREWQTSLARGLVPEANKVTIPKEPFLTSFQNALLEMQMPRFCRKNPSLINVLLDIMLDLYRIFIEEGGLEGSEEQKSDQQQQQQAQQSQSEGEPNSSPVDDESTDDMQQQMMDAMSQAAQSGEANGEGQQQDFDVSLEDSAANPSEGDVDQEAEEQKRQERMKEIADRVVDQFKEEWKDMADKMDKADKAFDGLDILELDDSTGFDASAGLWQESGWEELESLRRKLERLKELRELVRSLGRGSGKGPLKRAPAQVEKATMPIGVIRSSLEPSETRGLCRSDDISMMLPSELLLLAAKRPALRRLHFARQLERSLLSYERVAWVEENAKTLERTEIRPAAERGPIVLCLDTSASMRGAAEKVAKALTVECMRQAKREERGCYLYAFGGPDEVEELQLTFDRGSLQRVLKFLSSSFNGGTDINEPLSKHFPIFSSLTCSCSAPVTANGGVDRCSEKSRPVARSRVEECRCDDRE
eukprot:scaffold1741_cov409-Prasinococcus_capsulatus_cf.AAC.4